MSSADWLWDIQRDGSIQETHFAQGMPQQVEELQAAGE
jgi:hypothetical protein